MSENSMQKEIEERHGKLCVALIVAKLHPIGEKVWRATVDSYEDQGLHKVQAYRAATAARDLVCEDAAAKFADELGALPDVIEEIVAEAMTRAFG